MNETILIQGRKHGGCSFLFNKSISSNITYIELLSKRVCCIRVKTEFGLLYIFNVYMPCDSNNDDKLQEYNDVLSTISTCLNMYNVEFCIVAWDLNTDLLRLKSGNTTSLNSFVENENLEYILKKFPSKVEFTFTGIKNNKSLIDHYIISHNLIENVTDYYTYDSIDNLSDHVPLYCILGCKIDSIEYIASPIGGLKPQWGTASPDQIKKYKENLDNRFQMFSPFDGVINVLTHRHVRITMTLLLFTTKSYIH